MSEVLGIFSKAASLIGSLFLLLWKTIKFIFVKCWKFILLIGSLILTLFGIKKAVDKEN